ncbi:vacuolar ATP synthase subunit C [Tubulinosema ratisbonensis]|uniref:V-type proton ATPase subunit C n=1 Tax=Tubulinosema ratisbonensis TaxID=291195 RepID=A0A437AKL9_9MICR|nr:vacuolar ATP synthase subunit C [Tubulinosema ratisbonensis]
MLVITGLPDQQSKLLQSHQEEVKIQKLDLQSISCNGLASIISASEKLYELEKRLNNIINAIYTFLNVNYQEESKELSKEFDKLSFENNFFTKLIQKNLPLKSKRKLSERRMTIEDYISRTESIFREIEKNYSEKHSDFVKYIKRNVVEKRKIGNDLKTAALNNFCKEEKHEFLQIFYVVRNKKNKNPISSLFDNEKLVYHSIKIVAQDESDELISFYGMKSTEEKVKLDCKKYDFIYKSFLTEEQFENIKKNLDDFEETKKSHFIFLKDSFFELTGLICNFKFSKAYLDSILSYGLPPDYVFYAMKSNKNKYLNEFLLKFAKETEHLIDQKKYAGKLYGDLVVVNVSLPFYEEEEDK